jgi:hypothetical protein
MRLTRGEDIQFTVITLQEDGPKCLEKANIEDGSLALFLLPQPEAPLIDDTRKKVDMLLSHIFGLLPNALTTINQSKSNILNQAYRWICYRTFHVS